MIPAIVLGSTTRRRMPTSRHATKACRKNPDGSVDLYVGPTAPGGYEKNWLQTVPGKAWFAYFRLYGPLEPYLNRTWRLPDIESVT